MGYWSVLRIPMVGKTHKIVELLSIMKKNRLSNLELLRIVAMLLIVAHHFSLWGGGEVIFYPNNLNHLWTQIVGMWGKLGVNLFVLITGYFCVRSKFKISSLIYLWLTTLFYSLIFYCLALFWGHPFHPIELIKVLFPLTFHEYWFISCYAMLFLLTPFINKLINILTREHYFYLIVGLGFLWSVLPTIFFHPSLRGNIWEFSNLAWFIYLYLCSGYYRIHIVDKGSKLGMNKILNSLVLLLVFSVFVVALCDYVIAQGYKNWSFWFDFYLFNQNNLFVFITSILVFAIFQQINIRYSKIVNFYAALMFGIYLIHENPYVRFWIWKTLWNVQAHLNMPTLKYIIWSSFSIIVTFIICSFIEYLRQKLFNCFYAKLYEIYLKPIDYKIAEKF